MRRWIGASLSITPGCSCGKGAPRTACSPWSSITAAAPAGSGSAASTWSMPGSRSTTLPIGAWGWEAGGQEALRDALIAIARKRFPAVAAEYEPLIRQEEDAERLQVMIDRALAVASPEEIWTGPGT